MSEENNNVMKQLISPTDHQHLHVNFTSLSLKEFISSKLKTLRRKSAKWLILAHFCDYVHFNKDDEHFQA